MAISNVNNKHKGFTLLEVMVALAIFAVCALSLSQQAAYSTQRRQDTVEQEVAAWLAKNQLAAIQLRDGKERIDTFQGRENKKLAGTDWVVDTRVMPTGDKGLAQVTITVKLAAGQAHILALERYFLVTEHEALKP